MKKGFVILAALIVIIVSSISLVLFSSTGLNLVLRIVSPLTGGAVTIEDSGGTIARGWWLSGFKIRSDGADISAQEVRLDWQLSRLLEGNVHVSSISIKEIEIIIKESGSEAKEPEPSPFELPLIAMPLTIMVDILTVDGGILKHANAPEPLFVLDQLSLQMRASADQLIVEELAVKSPVFDTTLKGKLRFSRDWPLEVQGEWLLELADYSEVIGTATLSGTVNNPGFIVSVSDPFEVTLNGKLNDIFDELSWQASGEVVKFNPRDLSADLPILVVDATVESAGSIDDYSGRFKALIQAGDYPEPAVDLVFSGNQSSLAIEPATLSVSDNETTLTGMVDWQNDFSWNFLVQFNDFELSALDPRLAGLVSLSASTEGRYDDNLQYRLEISDFVGVFEALKQDVIGGLILDGNEAGLKVLSSDFTLGEGKVDIVGQVDWQDAVSWDTRILLHSFDPSAIEATLEGSINAEVNSHGIVSGTSVNGGIELERVSGSLAGYQLSGGGSIDYLDGNITIKDLFLENGRNHLAVDGTIAQTLDLNFSLDGPELNRIAPVLGGTLNARGTLAGTRAYPDLALMINGDSLSYSDYSAGTIVSDIRVSGERYGKIEATITGEAMNVSGHLIEQVKAELTGSIEYDDNLQYRFEISDFVGVFEALNEDVTGGLIVDGNESGLKVLSSDFTLGEGKVDIVGQVEWQDAVSWDTRILLHSFDPSAIEATLEGSINAEVNSHGIVSGTSVNGGIELERVSGSLAGYQLSGGGSIDYLDGNITIKDLFLENGRNHLAVDGTIAQTLDLTFSLDGHELNRVVPVLGGTVSARGTVAGTRAYPDLAVMINGDSLSYGDYSAGTIVSDIRVSGERDGKIEATIKGEAVNISGRLIQEATVELTGSMEDHHLAVSIDSDQGALQLSTDGVLSDRKIWQGQIKSLRVEHPRFGLWQNSGVSSVRVSEQSADIKDLCIISEDIEFCSEGSWEGPAGWSFDTRKLVVDLALLNNWSIIDPAASGVIRGSIGGSGDGTNLSSLQADFALDEMALGIKKNEYYEELKWFDTAVSVKLENNLLRTELYSRFVDDSFIKGTLNLSEFGDMSAPMDDLSVEGNLQTVINDMIPLKVLTGGYLEPKGELSADLAISGTIGDPRVAGDINLVDGEIHIPQLNITPKNINASINGRGDSVMVTLEAVSGEGRATADGEFNFDNKSWLGSVKIVGTNVELVNQKEVKMTADSDLLLTLGPDGGRLEGTVVIPQGLIQPEEMTGSESESDDVIMMGEAADSGSWPFNLAVKIDLGDNVKVDGYGLSGNLRGSLNLANTKSDFLAGRGELYLDNGLFSIYERELQITRSRVLFGGGPVDNPGLDVSARKTIKAEELGKEDIIVGVNIIGSVDDFEMDLFSIPSMDDADIIAYIVVGTSMSSSSGSESGAIGAALNVISMNQGNKILGDIGGAFAVDDLKLEGSGSDDTSLVVGKRLMDDLYISYDFNLYKNSGYFRIRYDFGRGFSVESKNSMESNGLSLLYSYEN